MPYSSVISRAPGLKLVVETLMSSLKPIGNIVVICCAFFIIFGILGVQVRERGETEEAAGSEEEDTGWDNDILHQIMSQFFTLSCYTLGGDGLHRGSL